MLSIYSVACQKTTENTKYQPQEQNLSSGTESVNAMQFGTMASDGENIYAINLAENLICRANLDTCQFEVNCGDLLCSHEGDSCSAKIPMEDDNVMYQLMYSDSKVYALGNQVYQIEKNAKKRVGRADYGGYGKIIFRDYIAYFREDDTLVVEELESQKQVCTFEDVSNWGQGNFYYQDYLYYVMEDFQLVRLNLITKEREVIEQKGASRASVYDGFIYYIKISEETDTNQFIRMDPETLEKEVLLDGVFYYNMLKDRIYYVTYPERTLKSVDFNGENQTTYDAQGVESFGWIFSFPFADRILVMDTSFLEGSIYYMVDEKQGIYLTNPMMLWE